MSDEPIIDHSDAWDLANMKRDESNLARCYIDLRKAAEAAVSGWIKADDVWGPMQRLLAILNCEIDEKSTVRSENVNHK